MADVEERLAQLEKQQAYQTNAILAALEARWAGEADSVDGWIKALDPTMTTDPKTPLY
jgi:uncharacterized coiled-coil protein SlyX